MSEPLNILFITADQWRGECLSARGHPMVKTPHLDALAAEGVLFKRHYANTAPCGPSRTSLHTGLYLQNHRSGTNGTPLDARHTNWAIESAKLGYDPVVFGYTDTGADPRELEVGSRWLTDYQGPLPGAREVCRLDGDPTPWTEWLSRLGYEVPEAAVNAYAQRAPGPEYEDGAAVPKPLAWPAEHDDVAFLAGEAMAYMKAARDPFVCHLSFLRPHPPWVAPEPYNALYDPAAVPGFARKQSPEAEGEQHPWLAWQLSRKPYRATGDEKRLRRLKAVYWGLMSRVDAEIGRLMAFLADTGLADRTLVIFTSDHGEQIGDHWLVGKCGWFEGSYHIPLIVRDPRASADVSRGRVVEAFTENVDIMPTMLEAIGAEVPVQCDGMSLAPWLEGRHPAWRTEAHWEFDFRDAANAHPETALGLTLHQCGLNVIRSERWKYVHFAALPPLLFDLEADPDEMTNLAGDPAYAPVMLEMAQKLISWRMVHDEQTLTHIALVEGGPVVRPSARY